jgi:hypothetical protein
VRDNIARLERQLEEYLDKQRKRFKIRGMRYTISEKKDYLIEVPASEAAGVRPMFKLIYSIIVATYLCFIYSCEDRWCSPRTSS